MTGRPGDKLAVRGRSFDSSIPPRVLSAIQRGTIRYEYRGVRMLKNPLDLAVYLTLLDRLQPRTVFEIGSHSGGSALWFADQLTTFGIEDPKVFAVDLNPKSKHDDPRVIFLRGDALKLGESLTEDILRSAPKPWLVIEDSAHLYDTTTASIRFFDDWLAVGDYLVIEDGIVRNLLGAHYKSFDNGPNRAVHDFLGSPRGGDYDIDESLCDLFGYNATWNPNGYLRRVR